MRKHYMTLCFKDNTEVTHIQNNGTIEVTFEQAVNKGFNTLVADIDGNIILNKGFNSSDVDFFLTFLATNKEVILMESRGEL